MSSAQVQVVFVNAEKMKLKKMESIEDADIKRSFASPSMHIFRDARSLENFLVDHSWKNKNLLMMSSGNFGGLRITELGEKLKLN
jgi:UDP-N-acetylmuramate: L-alanyl-gamma-D-glutamyl-meso-diaminopimelate ligase